MMEGHLQYSNIQITSLKLYRSTFRDAVLMKNIKIGCYLNKPGLDIPGTDTKIDFSDSSGRIFEYIPASQWKLRVAAARLIENVSAQENQKHLKLAERNCVEDVRQAFLALV